MLRRACAISAGESEGEAGATGKESAEESWILPRSPDQVSGLSLVGWPSPVHEL